MKSLRLRIAVVVFAVAAASAWAVASTRTTEIRYCCTPQQSIACANLGGTATCRTGVCQCLF
jgi:hypothetical protein